LDLFSSHTNKETYIPLAEKMRPQTLDEFYGQEHLVGEGKPIRKMIETNSPVSMILWGPPGVGKTTLAKIIANSVKAEFIQISAVASGVKEIRDIIEKAKYNKTSLELKTILFIDEIHRFNKAQQDSLLHSVEEGTIILIGATTENPSFEVISPLLSRCRIFTLYELSKEHFEKIIDSTLNKQYKDKKIVFEDTDFLIYLSGGDARKLLNGIEFSIYLAKPSEDGTIFISNEILKEAFQTKYIKFDKNAEEHYNIISAFIKSIRGSDPDAAVYWLARMLKGGEDPKFISRRMIVLASEDIGNADPFALVLATNAFTAVDYIGMPEARIVLSHTATYLACCPKSNAVYLAIEDAMRDVENLPLYDVPLHLRNAPTKLMQDLKYGKDYKYPHDFEGHFVEQQYLPDKLKDKNYYRPTNIGRERLLKDYLKSLKKK